MEHRYDRSLAGALVTAAIRLFTSEAKLGAATGYSQNAIWHAKRTGRVSAEMAVAIDKATGGQIPKAAMRPDLFGQPLEIVAQPAFVPPSSEAAAL